MWCTVHIIDIAVSWCGCSRTSRRFAAHGGLGGACGLVVTCSLCAGGVLPATALRGRVGGNQDR